MRELENDFGKAVFEQEPCSLAYPADFEGPLIAEWAEAVRQSKGWATDTRDEQVLANLHLGRYDTESRQFVPNMACVLLFAKDPVAIIGGCKIHCLRFSGDREGTGAEYSPLKDNFIQGTVPQVIVQSANWLDAQLRTFTRQAEGGKFHTSQEYPREAWYEVIVNACVHRSYGLRNAFITVKMFNDRLTIESPGGFMPGVSPENIYDTSPHPRNPHLYEAMWHLEFVRCNNEGAKRIRDYMKKEGLPPAEFSEKSLNYSFVRVTLRNDIAKRKLWSDEDSMKVLGEFAFEQLSDEERHVVNYVIEYGRINISDAQRLTQFSWPRSRKLLMNLTARGVLRRVTNVREGKTKDPRAHFVLRRGNGNGGAQDRQRQQS